ncbi:hypothetical protein CICLE_v10023863mg [Citrus x clementina]|uniref:Uncharacterized protein n=1 Tax=Citrus clementina TaxID=85681 RepID=V4TVW1_CITCL|nr:hypothetical protein CICLE_v10023863mg [Citrus x clementina]
MDIFCHNEVNNVNVAAKYYSTELPPLPMASFSGISSCLSLFDSRFFPQSETTTSLLRKVSPLALELFDRSMRRGLYCKSQSHRADYALQKKKKEVAAPEEVAFPQLTLFQVCFLPWH